jgi:hypothetical protein
MDARRQIDARDRCRMEPQTESRVDLKQVQPASIVALEVHLDDASEV